MKKVSIFLCLLVLLVLISACGSEYDPILSPNDMEKDEYADALKLSLEEPLPEDVRISFAGGGDIIMYYGNRRDAKKLAYEGGREYNFAPIFENVKHIIEKADISFINQETPMAGESYGYDDWPYFNVPRDLAYDIIEAGFDVVNLATNHMLDAGSQGLVDTIEFWNTLPVTTIGGYLSEEDFDNIRIVEREGIKIAFLSFTYGTNGLKLKSGYDVVIPYENAELIEAQVKKADEIADLVFVSMHWGSEYKFTPNSSQRSLAQMMANSGADVIIGHHPHVIQPLEWIESETEEGHRTLCAYSLGNFAAEQENDYSMVGGIVTFDIVRKKGKISIESPMFIPTVYYFNRSFYNNTVYLMEDFTDEMAKSHGIIYYGNTTSVKRLRSYVTNTISAEFLPDFLK